MQDSDKPRTPEMINRVVSAEIPDKNVNPKLYDIITLSKIKYSLRFLSNSHGVSDIKLMLIYILVSAPVFTL